MGNDEPEIKLGENKGWDNLIPAKPGEIRNPNGRPKKENTFSDICRELLQSKEIDITYTFPKKGTMVTSHMHMSSDKTMNHSLAAVLIKEGMGGNVKAIQEIIDRTDGKPKQTVDLGFDAFKIKTALDLQAANAPEPSEEVAGGDNKLPDQAVQ